AIGESQRKAAQDMEAHLTTPIGSTMIDDNLASSIGRSNAITTGMKFERGWSCSALLVAAWLTGVVASGFGQVSYQRLKSFGFAERLSGVCSEGALIEATDGALYGTTYTGGSAGRGSVFRLTKDGTGQTLLKSFFGPNADGANPRAGLL